MRLTINKKDKLDKINKCFLNMAEGIIKAGDSKVYELDFYILSILKFTNCNFFSKDAAW